MDNLLVHKQDVDQLAIINSLHVWFVVSLTDGWTHPGVIVINFYR